MMPGVFGFMVVAVMIMLVMVVLFYNIMVRMFRMVMLFNVVIPGSVVSAAMTAAISPLFVSVRGGEC